jgi:SNF family Na+-dependent transporter
MSLLIQADFYSRQQIDDYINSFYPIVSFMIMTGLCFVIIVRGVSRGIERVNKEVFKKFTVNS